ncbi:MAG: quinone oxidoreductase [Pseudomonadota bacterium]
MAVTGTSRLRLKLNAGCPKFIKNFSLKVLPGGRGESNPISDHKNPCGGITIKSITIKYFGGAEELITTETERPSPGRGEVLVKIACAGVNFIDIYMRRGNYIRSNTYQTQLSMILGLEAGGTVAELGEGVEGFMPGDRIAYCLARGSYAEYAAVPAFRLVKIPDQLSLPLATALMLQGSTAHYLTHSAFALEPGHTCLIHAGAGGVGQLLVQLAKLRGATVITTVGSKEKAGIAKACGADHTILYRDNAFREAAMDITGGKGVDVVYDSVGKDTIHQSIRSLKQRGLCIMFGASSGPVTVIDPMELAEAGSIFFTRPHLADYNATAEEVRWRADDLFKAVVNGKLTVAIDREYPLADVRQAHELLESRGSKGKLLLRVDY